MAHSGDLVGHPEKSSLATLELLDNLAVIGATCFENCDAEVDSFDGVVSVHNCITFLVVFIGSWRQLLLDYQFVDGSDPKVAYRASPPVFPGRRNLFSVIVEHPANVWARVDKL